VTDSPGPLPAGRPRDDLVRAVRDALTSAAVPEDAAAIVAVSGGPDSTALAYLVAEARPDLELTLAHVRHGLRDDRADVEVVTRHAAWLGLPLQVREVEVARRGRGIERAAREARYRALADVARSVGAAWTLLGHHADDQAETLLLRAARGTGTAGLAAMAPVRDGLVRPLLRLRRGDLRRFVDLEGLPVVEDPTNTDPALRRSVVRHELLAVLDRAGPDPVGALARLADLAREDSAALDRWASEVTRRARRRVGEVVAVHDDALADVPAAVARRVIRQLALEVAPAPVADDHHPPSSATVARILDLAPGRTVHLPGGIRASAGGGWRALYPAELPTVEPVELAVPGTTAWVAAGVRLVAGTPDTDPRAARGVGGQIAFELPDAWTPPPVRGDPAAVPPGGLRDRLTVVLPASCPPLAVRGRAPGDRIATPVGTQRLQDVFVDAGVPRPIRDRWPVVVAGARLVWVPGLVADARLLEDGRRAPGLLLVCERLTNRRSGGLAASDGPEDPGRGGRG
jgi:tRNA(Ile)-lysidine synthase